MIEIAHTNIQFKTKINGLGVLYDSYLYIRSSPGVSTVILLYITVVEVLAIFINADQWI